MELQMLGTMVVAVPLLIIIMGTMIDHDERRQRIVFVVAVSGLIVDTDVLWSLWLAHTHHHVEVRAGLIVCSAYAVVGLIGVLITKTIESLKVPAMAPARGLA